MLVSAFQDVSAGAVVRTLKQPPKAEKQPERRE